METKDLFDEDGYGDWSCAFSAAGADHVRRDIVEILHESSDSPEGYGSCNVELVCRMKDGRFGALSAWCDTTGWDCQSGGQWKEFDTEAEAREWVGIPVWERD